MAAQAVLKTLTPASTSPKKQIRRFNKMMSNTFKRFLCAVMAFVMLFVLMPVGAITAEAAESVENGALLDAAVFFSDLHTSKSNYKESNLKGVLNAVKTAGLPVSSVTSCGDAFSVNESSGKYDGDISKLTGYVQNVMGNIPVNYVWSDHDRYAKINGSYLDSDCGFFYGINETANYYIYELSMAYLSTNDRYNTGVISTNTSKVNSAISAFKETAKTLDKTKPLFIASHQPLLDRRDDNGHALLWANAINEVAEEMDVVFFFGHNHKYDKSEDYYYAKGSTMPVCSSSSGASTNVKLNFTHMCAGYLEPTSTGSYSSSGTRRDTAIAVSIYENTIRLTTYNANGIYNGNYKQDVYVTRDHAAPAHTHDFKTVTETVDATCIADGYTTTACDCGEVQTVIISATGHTYNSVITEPTLESEGYTTHTCSVCGDVVKDSYVPALTHNYQSVTVNATCTTNGSITYTCIDCGHSYVEVLVSSGHNYHETESTDATCTTAGSSVSTCTNCGDVITTETPALGHQYIEEEIGGSCTTAGKTVYTCANCNDTYTETSTATGHNYVASIVAPTCTDIGYTVYTCANCGVYYNTSYVSATGHNYVDTVTDATCTTAGHTTSRCTTCGHTITGDSIPALGHDYVASEGNGCVVYNCSRCTSSYTENIAGNFTYNKVTKFSNREAYVITLYSGGKYYALSHKNNVLSPVQVTVSRNKITSDVTEDMVWDYNNKILSYKDGNTTYKLYAKSASIWGTPTLQLSTSNSTNVTFSSSSLKFGSYYLRFSNNSIALNRSSSTTYLFIQNEA